jgi:hypothetical protein
LLGVSGYNADYAQVLLEKKEGFKRL